MFTTKLNSRHQAGTPKKLVHTLPFYGNFPLPLPPERDKYALSDISHKAQQVSRSFGTASRE
jgi:hypothetical protein